MRLEYHKTTPGIFDVVLTMLKVLFTTYTQYGNEMLFFGTYTVEPRLYQTLMGNRNMLNRSQYSGSSLDPKVFQFRSNQREMKIRSI